MNSVRVFFIGGSISFRALFGWLSPWIYIPSLLVAPVFQILLFAYIGRQTNTNSDEFYVIGNALQYTAIPCIFAMGHTIEGERWQQTVKMIPLQRAGDGSECAEMVLFLVSRRGDWITGQAINVDGGHVWGN